MKQLRCSLGRWFVALFLTVALIAGNGLCLEVKPGGVARFNTQNQAGIRVGVWANRGEKPLASGGIEPSTYKTDIGSGSFYFEAYFGYRIFPPAALEVSFGIVNRGDVTIRDQGKSYIGNLLVYPVQIRGKVYPLAYGSSSVQPFLMIGCGLYHGRDDIQFVSENAQFDGFVGDSQTDFNAVFGAGCDWPLAHNFGVDAAVSFMPISFSRGLFSVHKYDALTVTIGIKYLLPLRGETKVPPRRMR